MWLKWIHAYDNNENINFLNNLNNCGFKNNLNMNVFLNNIWIIDKIILNLYSEQQNQSKGLN